MADVKTEPDIEKLREEIARTCHIGWRESGRGIPTDWNVLDRFEKARWLEVADRILAIPAIADRLRLVPVEPMPTRGSS